MFWISDDVTLLSLIIRSFRWFSFSTYESYRSSVIRMNSPFHKHSHSEIGCINQSVRMLNLWNFYIFVWNNLFIHRLLSNLQWKIAFHVIFNRLIMPVTDYKYRLFLFAPCRMGLWSCFDVVLSNLIKTASKTEKKAGTSRCHLLIDHCQICWWK